MGLSTPSTGGGAPKDAEYVTGSSNSELSSETVVSPAGDILTQASFGASESVSISFGSFTVIDADNPTLFFGQVNTGTDGNNDGDVDIAVDETGGTTADYTLRVADADSALQGDGIDRATFTLPLPAGAAVKVINVNDPKGDNGIFRTRALSITV